MCGTLHVYVVFTLHGLCAVEPVSPESRIQLCAGYPKLSGGFRFVSGEFAQGFFNGLSLEGLQIDAAQWWNILPDRQREVLGVDERPFAHDRRPLEHVAQLSHVS